MNPRRRFYFWSLLSAGLLALPMSGRAAQSLLSEDFEHFNLQAPPANCIVNEVASMAIVDEPGHGKVLKLSPKAADKWTFIDYTLDASRLVDKNVRVAVLAKFPGTYIPLADKMWANPRVLLEAQNGAGTRNGILELHPQAGKPEWQSLAGTARVPQGTVQLHLTLRIDLVVAEVFLDNVSVETDADSTAPSAAQGGSAAGAGAASAPPPPPGSREAQAAKAPSRTLDDGGVQFNPAIAARLLKALPATPSKVNTMTWAGPSVSEKDAGLKLKSWSPVSCKFTGSMSGAPLALLASLPDFLARERPEVVFLAADLTNNRKPGNNERADWEDIEKLCVRLGAIPVLILPAVTSTEDIPSTLIKLNEDLPFPALLAKPPEALAKRATQLLGYLDKYVFCRQQIEVEAAKGKGGPADE